MSRIAIRRVSVAEIEGFARQVGLATDTEGVVPISMTRARAWARNPHAEPDDVCLLVGLVGGRCQGYLGLVPGGVRSFASAERVLWLSALYVAPAARRLSLGALLLLEAAKLGRVLVASGSSPEAERLYRALGFVEMPAVRFFELDLQRYGLAAAPLRAARRALRIATGRRSDLIDRLIDRSSRITSRALVSLLLLAVVRPEPVTLHRVLGALPGGFSDAGCPTGFDRGRAVLEWMIRFPWVATRPEDMTAGYFFGDASEAFEYRVFDIRRSGEVAGAVIAWLLARHGAREVHVLDFAPKSTDARTLIRLALEQAAEFQATRVCLPAVCAGPINESGLARWLFREKERRSFFRPRGKDDGMTEWLRTLVSEYADGDVAFA